MIIVDTSGLLANYDRSDKHHGAAAAALTESRVRVLSPFVLAELDYLVGVRVGRDAQRDILDDVADGVFQLADFSSEDVAEANLVIRKYADLALGLTDASLVVLSRRHVCHDLLTLDQRHFRTVTGFDSMPFRLLPGDS